MEGNTAGKAINPNLMIGVTGHRWIRETKELISTIDQVIGRIIRTYPGHLLNVLSPLAEGADRILAKRFLNHQGRKLTVILPIPLDEYVKDFPSEQSEMEFHRLLEHADKVIAMPSPTSRAEGYLAGGRYIVDHCDLLVAIWDGKVAHGRGGTGEIVHLARERGLPLVWIPCVLPDPGAGPAILSTEKKGAIRFERFPQQNAISQVGDE